MLHPLQHPGEAAQPRSMVHTMLWTNLGRDGGRRRGGKELRARLHASHSPNPSTPNPPAAPPPSSGTTHPGSTPPLDSHYAAPLLLPSACALQSGHATDIRSHRAMHAWWKRCRHARVHTISPPAIWLIQTAHTLSPSFSRSVGPGEGILRDVWRRSAEPADDTLVWLGATTTCSDRISASFSPRGRAGGGSRLPLADASAPSKAEVPLPGRVPDMGGRKKPVPLGERIPARSTR
eukprot:scaffold10403_cov101-Isochrysis_galbana.AAC.4